MPSRPYQCADGTECRPYQPEKVVSNVVYVVSNRTLKGIDNDAK